MLRYLRLFAVQLRASTQLALQYRVEFFVEATSILFWTAATIVPLVIVFDRRDVVAGWTWHESLLVLGFFLLLKSLLEGAVNPSLISVVEHIRKGTLDFVLIKPADAQFLVSTAKFIPSAIIGAVASIALLGWGLAGQGRVPEIGGILAVLLLLAASVALLYSLWILVVCAAFFVVRVDNLSYLFLSVFDAARWPSAVFRGFFHVLFTFIIPLALMTTYPAEALLGRLTIERLGGAVVGAALFAALARRVWLFSLGRYTSASS